MAKSTLLISLSLFVIVLMTIGSSFAESTPSSSSSSSSSMEKLRPSFPRLGFMFSRAILLGENTCPSGNSCGNTQTCCQLSSGSYGCCPYQDADCCTDGQHCCPQGYACDLSKGECLKS